MRGGGGRGRRKDEHQEDGGGGYGQQGGGAEDEEVRVIVHRPLIAILPGEEEEDLNDVVEVGAGAEEALVPILNLPPTDSPCLLSCWHRKQTCSSSSMGQVLSLVKISYHQLWGGWLWESMWRKMCHGKDEAVLAWKGTSYEATRHLHSQEWLPRWRRGFNSWEKNEQTMGMGLHEKQRHSAALKALTVNLAPANYKQEILSR